MDLSQITLIQMEPGNQFTYDQAGQDTAILHAERRRNCRQALWLGTLRLVEKYAGVTLPLLQASTPLAARPQLPR